MRSKSGSKLESKRGQTSGCLLTVQVSSDSNKLYNVFDIIGEQKLRKLNERNFDFAISGIAKAERYACIRANYRCQSRSV